MRENDTKAVYAEFPAALHRQVKADAAQLGQTIREWLLEATLARLRERDQQAAE